MKCSLRAALAAVPAPGRSGGGVASEWRVVSVGRKAGEQAGKGNAVLLVSSEGVETTARNRRIDGADPLQRIRRHRMSDGTAHVVLTGSMATER